MSAAMKRRQKPAYRRACTVAGHAGAVCGTAAGAGWGAGAGAGAACGAGCATCGVGAGSIGAPQRVQNLSLSDTC